jgi:hypothetical protein
MGKTRLSRVEVLHEGKKLAVHGLLHETKESGRVVYQKDSRVQHNKRAVIRLADSPSARSALPTKRRPAGSNRVVRVSLRPDRGRATEITIDDIDSFKKVKGVSAERFISASISESVFRDGVKKILGELGHFADWGGEQNDIYSSKLQLNGRRRAAALAFKGPATKGILTPGKCGKNGDQVQRLMESPAGVFLFQYHGQIAQSVIAQMRTHALLHSIHARQEVHYGVINGEDSERLRRAYPHAFKKAVNRGR